MPTRRQVEVEVFEDYLVGVVAVGEVDVVEVHRQRPGRKAPGSGLRQMGAGGEQLLDPGDPRPGLLEILHLGADLVDGVANHLGVVEHQVHRPDGHRTVAHQRCSEPEHQGEPEHVHRNRRRPQQGEPEAPPDLERQPLAMHRGETMHHVGHCSVGSDVLGAPQLLAEEPEERGALRPHLAPPRDGDRLDLHHECHRQPGEDRHPQPDQWVLSPHQGDDRHHQDQVAHHLHHEGREEVGQRGDVTVDPLDQLARGLGLVERHVELEQVTGELHPHLVGSRPADLGGEIGGGDAEHLVADGKGDEAGGESGEP